ncbi:germ cell-specific gene 1-like protein [Ornithorhynchus anatinus]|uniref:germ cell-specific gene 1-like protein n=1 Tax=Ornithorhynchus anatinus TaxID=9258 RepID=UPI0010A85C62|nr:germ cell-specific gene 1-like protein [Ornithorhynchus anatinus]
MASLSPRGRGRLALALTALALALASLAFSTNYWCRGTHKVVKPPCLSAIRHGRCLPSPGPSANLTGGGTPPDATLDPHAVQYIWETGEDKFSFQPFHAGFWYSCEEHLGEEICRSFMDLPPESERGVLWLSVASEALSIALLAIGFLLLCLEAGGLGDQLLGLKVNAFASVVTVLSGLLGMVAHMMFMTVFQVSVHLGPKDWRPQSWYYGWSFGLAWLSFSLCMAASVLTLNAYTKTLLEFRFRRRIWERGGPPQPPGGPRPPWGPYVFGLSDTLLPTPTPDPGWEQC